MHVHNGLKASIIALAIFAISAGTDRQAIGATATVTVNRSYAIATSSFGTAAVVAQDNNNSNFLTGTRNVTAQNSATGNINTACRYFGIPIMGWSFPSPEPTAGNYQLGTITAAVNKMVSSTPNCTPVITLCTCPGWMKADGNDWNFDEAPTPAHNQDFANLCVQIVNAEYPKVKYYQVWNEMKGYWSSSLNDWDMAAYTAMYNLVYNAIKTAHPDVKVGGPYITIEGSGTNAFLPAAQQAWCTATPMTARNQGDFLYWLQHANGADFINFDRGTIDYHDTNTYTDAQGMSLHPLIGSICNTLWTMMGSNATGPLAHKQLPIWCAESYPWTGASGNYDMTAACMASWCRQMALNHGSAAFIWGPEDNTTASWSYSLFSNATNAGGGANDPVGSVLRYFNQYFPSGTVLYNATSSTGNILALASANKLMLINISATAYTVTADGVNTSVPAYTVVVIN